MGGGSIRDEVLCVVLSLLGGVVNGSFMTPHRLLQRRKTSSHEKIWLLYTGVGLVVAPWACALLFVGPLTLAHAYTTASPKDLGLTTGMGMVWGFGSIAMGYAVQMVGQSISFVVILGTMASCGSMAALAIQHTDEMLEKEGILCMAGLAVATVAVILCVWAGLLKDRSRNDVGAADTWLGRTILRDYTDAPYKKNYLPAGTGSGPRNINSGIGTSQQLGVSPDQGPALGMYGSVGGASGNPSDEDEEEEEEEEDGVHPSLQDWERDPARNSSLPPEMNPLLQQARGKRKKSTQQNAAMVAKWQSRRHFLKGTLVCLLGGILATGMNMIVVLGDNIVKEAKAQGTDKEYATLVVWTMGVGIGGALVNGMYSLIWMIKRRKSLDPLETVPMCCCCCGRVGKRTAGAWALKTDTEEETGLPKKSLFWREGSEINSATIAVQCCDARVILFWCMGSLMGVLWFGGTFLYGAASQLSDFGTVAGWPIFILSIIMTANFWAAVLGEWKGTRPKEKWIMVASLLCMAGAIVTIGFSAQ